MGLGLLSLIAAVASLFGLQLIPALGFFLLMLLLYFIGAFFDTKP